MALEVNVRAVAVTVAGTITAMPSETFWMCLQKSSCSPMTGGVKGVIPLLLLMPKLTIKIFNRVEKMANDLKILNGTLLRSKSSIQPKQGLSAHVRAHYNLTRMFTITRSFINRRKIRNLKSMETTTQLIISRSICKVRPLSRLHMISH